MNWTFVLKELKESKWVILTILILLGATALIYPYSYSSNFTYLLQQGTTYEKFLWYDWFLKAQLQLAIVAAIIMGSSSMAREEKECNAWDTCYKAGFTHEYFITQVNSREHRIVSHVDSSNIYFDNNKPDVGCTRHENRNIAFRPAWRHSAYCSGVLYIYGPLCRIYEQYQGWNCNNCASTDFLRTCMGWQPVFWLYGGCLEALAA